MAFFKSFIKIMVFGLLMSLASPSLSQHNAECDHFWYTAHKAIEKHVDQPNIKHIVIQFLDKTERIFNLGIQVDVSEDTVVVSSSTGEVLEIVCKEFSDLVFRKLFTFIKPLITNSLKYSWIDADFCEYIGDLLISSIDETNWAMNYSSMRTFFRQNSLIGCSFISDSTDGYKIIALFDTTTAYHCGLRKGDHIESIRSIPTKYMGKGYFQKFSSGDLGDSISMTVRRNDELVKIDLVVEEAILSINRDEDIVVKTLEQMPKTGYVKLGSFNLTNERIIGDFIIENQRKLNHLIIDARYSQGGTFKDVRKLGERIFHISDTLWVENLREPPTAYSYEKYSPVVLGSGKGLNPKMRISILISENTASGTEIFLIPFTKLKNARFYGSETRGYMSIHKDYGFRFDEVDYTYRITVGRVHSLDKSIKHGSGIKPHVVLSDGQDALEYVIEELKSN